MNKILQHHYGAKGTTTPINPNNSPNTHNNTEPLTQNSTYQNSKENDELKVEEERIQKWIDQYNSPRESVRFTSERFPKSFKLLKEANFPLAAIIQPYYSNFKDGIPVANFGNNQIVRCNACRNYINPFCQFMDGGSKWKCNLCGKIEATPSFYFCKLKDETGERTDKFSKAELFSGSYDIKAGADYMSRPPTPPIYFFLIDVSKEAVQSGMLEMTIHVLKDTINNDLLWGGQRTLIGIITYDSSVHFYNLKQNLKQPQMIVVNDLEDLFLPIPDDLLVNVSEAKDLILNLLDMFHNMFATQQNQGSCLQKAITAAVKIFKHLGGKLIILQASDNLSFASLNNNKKDTKSSEIKNHMLPSTPYFCSLSAELHHAFISVTLFIFSQSFKDMITLGELARYLNGDVYYYPQKPMRKQSYFYDFKTALIKDYTWESVFRIRVSRGWQISQIYGNFVIKSTDLLSLTNLDENKSLVYEFNLLEDAQTQDNFTIQTALLYTTSNGERRIRVHNYSILLTNSINDIYSYADPTTLSIYMFRQGLDHMYKKAEIGSFKALLINKTREILRQSSNLKQKQPAPGQLNPHENLEILPLNILGILKNKILNGRYDKSIETDERNVLRIILNCLPVDETMLYFVPYLFNLLELRNDFVGVYDEDGNFNFPSMVPLSYTSLKSNDMYLMDEGSSLIMFIGKHVDQTTLLNIFGVSSINEVKEFNEDMLYHNSKDVINERIYNLITELRSRKSNKYCPLYIIKEGDSGKIDQMFFYKLIQDKLESYFDGYNISYNEFISMLS